ncbi:antirepressor [Corynebacterium phage CL31]|nr:antirepressor [Corynebacterium phage CL31]
MGLAGLTPGTSSWDKRDKPGQALVCGTSCPGACPALSPSREFSNKGFFVEGSLPSVGADSLAHAGEFTFHDEDSGEFLCAGEVWVSPNHICMALDIDWKSQHRKLSSKPWAVMVKLTMTAADGKNYQTTMIDRKTLGMWLATIDARRIKSDYARSILEAYQVEATAALDSYFHEGAAINPRAGLDAETLIEKFHLPRNYGEALRELADTTEKVEELTVENTALKGGDGIRVKDFIKTYFTAPNERAIFEWFYFNGYLIDGRLQDDDGRALRGSGGGPKLRWDHMHPTYIGRLYVWFAGKIRGFSRV